MLSAAKIVFILGVDLANDPEQGLWELVYPLVLGAGSQMCSVSENPLIRALIVHALFS